MQDLNTSSFIVLGLVAQLGEATSYDLKTCADNSVGFFWNFSRASLYKEPARLVDFGLLNERQETDGRRRRLYTLTPDGQKALSTWLDTRTDGESEIRDIGLLKLFFAANGSQEALDTLITDQIAAHTRQLETYRTIEVELAGKPDCRFDAAALHMGLLYEQMSIEFWSDLARKQLKVAL